MDRSTQFTSLSVSDVTQGYVGLYVEVTVRSIERDVKIRFIAYDMTLATWH